MSGSFPLLNIKKYQAITILQKKKRKNNNDSMLSDAFYEYVQLSGL